MHGASNSRRRVTKSPTPQKLQCPGFGVPELTYHITARAASGARGSEMSSFLVRLVGPKKLDELEESFRRCGYAVSREGGRFRVSDDPVKKSQEG